jgi:glycerol uptake facilitator-like aquaporin
MAVNSARKIGAEVVGTALLLAAVVGSGIMGEMLAEGNMAIALLANSLATAAALVVLITILGPVSGAHFNPVVSLVMALRGAIPVSLLVPYVLAQVFGAIAGVWLAHAMFDLNLWQVSEKVRTGSGQWIAECVAAFGLVLAIIGTLRYRAESVAANVGLYILAAYWFTASTSFANPAVTIARSMTNTFAGIAPGSVLAFISAQLVGALLAHYLARRLLDGEV